MNENDNVDPKSIVKNRELLYRLIVRYCVPNLFTLEPCNRYIFAFMSESDLSSAFYHYLVY